MCNQLVIILSPTVIFYQHPAEDRPTESSETMVDTLHSIHIYIYIVRVADRLTIFLISRLVHLHTHILVGGLIHLHSRGFITILVSATQAPLASPSKKQKPPEPLRLSSASHVWAAQPDQGPRCLVGASRGP